MQQDCQTSRLERKGVLVGRSGCRNQGRANADPNGRNEEGARARPTPNEHSRRTCRRRRTRRTNKDGVRPPDRPGSADTSSVRPTGLIQDLEVTIRGHVVVKIFVHRRKPERNEQTSDVQHCTSTCCICILSIVISVKCMVLEMHLRIRKV